MDRKNNMSFYTGKYESDHARDKKNNQMDLVQTKCKQIFKSHYRIY